MTAVEPQRLVAEGPVPAGLAADPLRWLAHPSWSPSPLVPAGVRAEVRWTVLAAREGRRATLRLQAVGAQVDLDVVVKVVRAAELTGVVRAARTPAGLPPEKVRVPAVVAVSSDLTAVASPVLQGTGLDGVPAEGLHQALVRLPQALAAVHALPAGTLPPWTAAPLARKLVRTAATARGQVPGASASGLVTEVAAALSSLRCRAAPVLVHGDVTPRNLLWDADDASGVPLALLDWDRASCGPREVDLAGMVGLLHDRSPAAACALADDYERCAGVQLEREVLDVLVRANRLVRALRRAAEGKDRPIQTERRLEDLAG